MEKNSSPAATVNAETQSKKSKFLTVIYVNEHSLLWHFDDLNSLFLTTPDIPITSSSVLHHSNLQFLNSNTAHQCLYILFKEVSWSKWCLTFSIRSVLSRMTVEWIQRLAPGSLMLHLPSCHFLTSCVINAGSRPAPQLGSLTGGSLGTRLKCSTLENHQDISWWFSNAEQPSHWKARHFRKWTLPTWEVGLRTMWRSELRSSHCLSNVEKECLNIWGADRSVAGVCPIPPSCSTATWTKSW